jgi:hypothetical protein
MSILESAVALIRGESNEQPVADAKLTEANERVQHAKREMDAASLAVEEHEQGAEKRLQRARLQLTEAELDLDRIERARRLAAEREAARVQKHREEERRREAEALRAAQIKLREQVAKADAKIGELAAVLEGVMRAQDAVARHAPGAVRQVVADANAVFWACLTWRLRFMPGTKLQHPFMEDAKAAWSQYFPEPAPVLEENDS